MNTRVNVLMIGDIVGESGIAALERELPALIERHAAAFVVANGENAADGFGMTEEAYRRISAAGVDVITSGNHIWEKRDFYPLLDAEERMLRPANYPPGSPGHGYVTITKIIADTPLNFLVINVQGRELMTPIDCPFRCVTDILDSMDSRPPDADVSAPPPSIPSGTVIIVDFHAESTREKEALGFYLDGRVSLFAGTHTHVQTADEKILPAGTAYITDLGMTGPEDSCLGMDTQICLDRAVKQILFKMACSNNPGKVSGLCAGLDTETGRALGIERI